MTQLNNRYKNFYQNIYTAGDIGQIYDELGTSDVYPEMFKNTLKYIYFKFKKGIFVNIVNGKVDVFLPFNNNNFINEYYDKIVIDPDILEKHDGDVKQWLYSLHPKAKLQTILPMEKWYSNNGLFRYEEQARVYDQNSQIFKEFLEQVCQQYQVQDCFFFLNNRDFPILRNNGKEAYNNIFGDEEPMKSFAFSHYIPILSMTGNENYSDI
eukprot:Pgem_evm1s6026